MSEYKEKHWQNVEDVGIAFDEGRVWICFNGASVLRAKMMPSGEGHRLFIEFTEPDLKVPSKALERKIGCRTAEVTIESLRQLIRMAFEVEWDRVPLEEVNEEKAHAEALLNILNEFVQERKES